MQSSRWSFALFSLTVAASLSACGSDGGSDSSSASSSIPASIAPPASSAPTTEAATNDGSIVVDDSTGTPIELAGPAVRVACLTEPCADALVELGMVPVAISPNGVGALPEFFGDGAADISTIGGSFFEPSLEDVVASTPDLVIGLEGVHESVRESLGDIPLYIVGLETTDEAVEFLRNVGVLTGNGGAAETAAAAFTTKLADAIAAKPDPAISAAVVYTGEYGFNINGASTSVVANMIGQLADYPFADEDAASQEGGFGTFSIEQLLEQNPDYIFVSTIAADGGQGESSATVMGQDAVWSKLDAVAAGKVVDVRTPLWQYGRGTHSLGIILDEFLAAVG